jgi:sugar lactone lactonase YvrE
MSNTRPEQLSITVAGGHGHGDSLQQLWGPHGLVVDDEDTVFIADCVNHRIVAWKKGDTEGHVVAGGQGEGSGLHQLHGPTDVLIDKETNSLIICDYSNRRVVRWPLKNCTQGELLIENIFCWGLAMDKLGCLYVSDTEKHEVRRFPRGNNKGTVVASWTGAKNAHEDCYYIFVDKEQSLYLSDWNNHRVMKWMKGASEGIVVAGGKGQGKELTQLNFPNGVWVDDIGTVYVAEAWNNRVTRWPKNETTGAVVANITYPKGLSFNQQGNMYVADYWNSRVQKFELGTNQ